MVDLAFTRPHPFPDKSLYLRWRIRGGKVGPAIFAAIDVALLEFRFRLTPVPGVHVHNQDGVRVAPTGFSDSENPQHKEYVPRRPLGRIIAVVNFGELDLNRPSGDRAADSA
jgi:hypothetical protein